MALVSKFPEQRGHPLTTVHLRPIGTKEKEGRLLPQFACQERDEASDLYRDMAIGRIDRLQLYRADIPSLLNGQIRPHLSSAKWRQEWCARSCGVFGAPRSLAEVGVADVIIEPVPLVIGPISQRGFDFSIMPTEDGWLRFNNHVHGIAHSFDFRADHSDEAAMAATHSWLMQDPGSPFTNALAVLRHTADGYVALQNDRLRIVTPGSVGEHRITSADHLADTFETIFDLDIPRPERVWDRVQAIGREKAA
jgi:hypothetical protein